MLSDHKKLYIVGQETWSHHRSGWAYTIQHMIKHMHIDAGVIFIGYLDGHFRTKPDGGLLIKDRWVGVMHNTLNTPSDIKKRHPRIHDLTTFSRSQDWHVNKGNCQGIITLSNYTASCLGNLIDAPVISLVHPTKPTDVKFDPNRFNGRILHIGHWLRNFQSFYGLRTNKRRLLLKPFQNLDVSRPPKDVEVRQHVSNDEYDRLLTESIVFLDLFEAGANNVVIECIERSTPIVINRLPAVEEYLGKQYPLFYEHIDEASDLVNDNDRIVEAHRYLMNLGSSQLSVRNFIRSFIKSSLYQSL